MNSIVTIDCQYVMPRFAAAYLMVEGSEAAFIDNNTTHSVPLLLAALKQQGLSPEQVKYVIITHVHLDHAGGSSALMKACPHATLLAHPRAAPHMIDPEKLVRSAKLVYGEVPFREMYGEIEPISAARVRQMGDGEVLRFGSRELTFLHTRGHANHHFCIFDSLTESIFTGDAFGLCYPDLQKHGFFIFPSSSPTDFDPEEARKAIDRIVATGAKRAYLTHFGGVEDLAGGARRLLAYLDHVQPLFQEVSGTALGDTDTSELETKARELISSYFEGVLKSLGWKDTSKVLEILKMDIELNAAGMIFAAQKKRKANKAKES